MKDGHDTFLDFFRRLGFSIIRDERSESFGNFIVEACSDGFCMMGARDKSFESIEVRALNDPNEWYILPTVMTLVLGESKLVQEIDLDEQMKFIESHKEKLAVLFSPENYGDTKRMLGDLARYRGKLLFPDWYE